MVFIKVAAATPDILVADCAHNRQEIVEKAREMAGNGAKILVFPELCLTGYTCQDLFWQGALFTQGRGGAEDNPERASGCGRSDFHRTSPEA